jgi:Uma2 family endonuclease
MTAEAAAKHFITVEKYLAGEETAEVKHEYLGGLVYAMAGATNTHNQLAGNTFASLHSQLRGQRCQPFNSDTKVRVQFADHTRFYYPGVQVVCRQNPGSDHFQDDPAVIVEVVSSSTRRTDEQEKRAAYFHLPSLRVYVLIEQESVAATVWRRGDSGFVREDYEGRPATIPLAEIGAQLALADVYEEAVPAPAQQ